MGGGIGELLLNGYSFCLGWWKSFGNSGDTIWLKGEILCSAYYHVKNFFKLLKNFKVNNFKLLWRFFGVSDEGVFFYRRCIFVSARHWKTIYQHRNISNSNSLLEISWIPKEQICRRGGPFSDYNLPGIAFFSLSLQLCLVPRHPSQSLGLRCSRVAFLLIFHLKVYSFRV